MPTTLKDIAAAAGVSIGTVDRALKNRGRVNPQVAEKIKELAKEMDYHPNKIASGLVNRSRKHKIAVILHVTGNDFFDEIIKGIRKAEREIRDYGMSVQLYPCKDFDASMQLANIEQAIAEGANAIVIVPINSTDVSKKIRQLGKENFPVVFLNTYLNRVSCFSSIHCDYFRSGRIGAMLLNLIAHDEGHAMAFFPSTVMLGNNARKEGCMDYFHSNPCPLRLEKIVELSNNKESNYDLMIKELTKHKDVNSILFCGDAKMGVSVLDSIDRPLKAVFYDFADETRQGLKNGRINAAITQAPRDQGYQSINVLFQYFTSGKIPPKDILMDSQIMFKESID